MLDPKFRCLEEPVIDHLSNYEILDLLATYSSDSASHFMNFVGMFSAYLAATYLAAGKLGRPALIFVSALYAATILLTATGQYLTLLTLVDILGEVARRHISAGNVAVFANLLDEQMGSALVYLNLLLQGLGCLGSIIFAFHFQRNATSA